MKKNFKRFFTLKHKANDGFTLVELIVVIAILAILGGVAVPVYSGYIAKAERAADEELLASLNTAFASACAMGGQDHYNRTDASASMANAEGGRTATVTVTGIEGFDEDFAGFYEGGVFKVYTDLNYNALLGLFEGMDEAAVIEALKVLLGESSYDGFLGELTGDIGSLVGTLGEYLKTPEGKEQLLNSGFNDYLATLGIDAATETNTQKLANAAVLYLAESATKMSDTDIYNAKGKMTGILMTYANGGGINEGMLNAMAADTKSGLASYAMLYATAEAIALQQPGGKESDAYKQLSGTNPENGPAVITAVDELFRTVGSDAIKSYVGTEGNSQMSNDMDAYIETMQAMNSKENELKGDLSSDKMFSTENETVNDLLGKLGG